MEVVCGCQLSHCANKKSKKTCRLNTAPPEKLNDEIDRQFKLACDLIKNLSRYCPLRVHLFQVQQLKHFFCYDLAICSEFLQGTTDHLNTNR